MDRYHVVLVSPPGYAHAPALRDVGRLLVLSFESLGVPCKMAVNTLDREAVNVILGYHLLSDPSLLAGRRTVIYQLEQLSEREGWFDAKRLEVLRRAGAVWDYDRRNIGFLEARGLEGVRHLPLGFHEGLGTIPDVEPEIDVLFYGSINERRKAILSALAPHARVHALFGAYGEKRDAHIAQARIVLNVHYYESQLMEQVRISYLLNNRRFVLSETAADNPYGDALATAPYDRLVEACRFYLAHPEARVRLAAAGHETLRRHPMTDGLRAVLATEAPTGGDTIDGAYDQPRSAVQNRSLRGRARARTRRHGCRLPRP